MILLNSKCSFFVCFDLDFVSFCFWYGQYDEVLGKGASKTV